MRRLITFVFYVFLFFIAACQQQDSYQSQADEVFPPVKMKYAALFRMDNLPVSPAFFQGQWTIVTFGNASCADDCLKRLVLINEVESAKKLFVIDGLAGHARLRELGGLFPNLAIAMGTTASSFDNFSTQFDTDTIELAQKNRHIYLVNPSAELVFSLFQDAIQASDIDREIALFGQ